MGNFNILFTSAGRRVSLIRHFKSVLQDMELKGNIVTTDMQKNAPASFVADIREQVPRVTDPNYIKTLKEVCLKHNIRLLIPLIDTELILLAGHKHEFESQGTTLLVSSPEVNEICFDKRKTYRFFKNIGLETPELFDAQQLLGNPDVPYPVLIKPANGSCSIGVTKIGNDRELNFFKDYITNAIIQEYIEGEEYTLDVLVDFKGRVCSVVPRLRIETRTGEISKGMTIKNQFIIEAGKKVAEALPQALGCITIQCFLTKAGHLKFIEINPRFGGGIPLSIAAGADFPRWIIEMMIGKQHEISIDGWQDGVVMLRYDDAIFVTKKMIL